MLVPIKMSVDSSGHGGVVMEVKSIEILDFRGSVYNNRGKPPTYLHHNATISVSGL